MIRPRCGPARWCNEVDATEPHRGRVTASAADRLPLGRTQSRKLLDAHASAAANAPVFDRLPVPDRLVDDSATARSAPRSGAPAGLSDGLPGRDPEPRMSGGQRRFEPRGLQVDPAHRQHAAGTSCAVDGAGQPRSAVTRRLRSRFSANEARSGSVPLEVDWRRRGRPHLSRSSQAASMTAAARVP